MSNTEPQPVTTPLDSVLDAAWRDIVELHSEQGGYPIARLFDHVQDAGQKAYALGVEDARAEAALVTDTMQQVHEDRMSTLNSTITAALMAALGTSELTINPDDVAKVWRNHRLQSTLNPDKTITYRLEKLTQ